jgi:hypothetical protein
MEALLMALAAVIVVIAVGTVIAIAVVVTTNPPTNESLRHEHQRSRSFFDQR